MDGIELIVKISDTMSVYYDHIPDKFYISMSPHEYSLWKSSIHMFGFYIQKFGIINEEEFKEYCRSNSLKYPNLEIE